MILATVIQIKIAVQIHQMISISNKKELLKQELKLEKK